MWTIRKANYRQSETEYICRTELESYPTMATIPIRMSPFTPKSFPSSTKTFFSIHTNKLITTTTNNNNNKTKLLILSCLSSKNGTECPVPLEQQPINEYQSLSTSFPFSWAAGYVVEFGSRLFVVGFCFALFVGLPVAWFGTIGAQSEPVKRIVGAASSGVLAVTFAVVRMYLGWAYVGNRLLSATVECNVSFLSTHPFLIKID
jgi:hypothetical protein